MIINLFFVLGHCIILCNLYNFVIAKPFIGNNIKTTNQTEFPYVVSIIRINFGNPDLRKHYICTGTLISRRDVVTAMHCLKNEISVGIKVVVGSNDFRCGSKYYLYWWLTYDRWASLADVPIEFEKNDIANLRLMKSISEEIVPIQISHTPISEFYKSEVTLTGWSSSNETEICPILKKVNVIILSNDECMDKLQRLSNRTLVIDERHAFCTYADPYVLLQNGDSGGPVLYQNMILGVNMGTGPHYLPQNHPSLLNLHMSSNYYYEFLNSMIYE